MTYEEYLKTDHWQRTRVVALRRAWFRCQVCNQGDITLDVHHRTYERLGNERPDDLTVLCRGCHDRHHRFDELLNAERERVFEEVEYWDQLSSCFNYSGPGLCRRCGSKATSNFGETETPELACGITCDILLNQENNDLVPVSESPHVPCENCLNLAQYKFRYSVWGYEDVADEHMVCSAACRDLLTKSRDREVLTSEHLIDAGLFAGTSLASLDDWYLEGVIATVPKNGSKVRRACEYEQERRLSNSARHCLQPALGETQRPVSE